MGLSSLILNGISLQNHGMIQSNLARPQGPARNPLLIFCLNWTAW